MSENLTPKNTKTDQFDINTEEIDYQNLIIRLKEIKKNIALLEKVIFK